MFSDHTRGSGWSLPILEVWHRQRARVEDRLRALEGIGMRNLPFHGFAQNQMWLEVVCLAAHLFAWLQIFGWGAQRSACGNRNGYACGSSPSPAGSSTPAADDCSGFREAGATTTSSPPPQRR